VNNGKYSTSREEVQKGKQNWSKLTVVFFSRRKQEDPQDNTTLGEGEVRTTGVSRDRSAKVSFYPNEKASSSHRNEESDRLKDVGDHGGLLKNDRGGNLKS